MSEPNFGFEENVFTEEDIRRFENDYRMPKRNKDEIVEFKFGTLDRKSQLPKREEPKKEEQAPVTSLRSLRQAYTRQRYYPIPSSKVLNTLLLLFCFFCSFILSLYFALFFCSFILSLFCSRFSASLNIPLFFLFFSRSEFTQIFLLLSQLLKDIIP